MIDWIFFASENPSEELIYFADCWENFCLKLSKPTIYDSLISPHFLVNEIIIELNINEKDNSKHLDYFKDTANTQKSFYFLFTPELCALWDMLIKKLQNPNKDILLKIANDIQSIFMTDDFLSYLEDKTKNIIFDKKDKNKIQKCAIVIIFEFIYRQFEIKTISTLCDKVFSSYNEIDYPDGKHFITSYPYKSIITDPKKYNQIVKEEVINLQLIDRFQRIFELLKQPEKTIYIVFYVKGLHLSQEETFENITFYNPLIKKKCNGVISDQELFHDANYEIGSNAIVKISCKDSLFGVNIAKKQVSNICDYLRLIYKTEANYEIHSNEYLICDEKLNVISTSIGNNSNPFFDLNIDIIQNNNKEDISVIYKRLYANISTSDSKIINDTLHFYRKGIETSNQEEQLLNLWISLENLFSGVSIIFSKNNEDRTKFSKICDCLINHFIFRYFYSCGWSLYDKFNYYFTSVNVVNSRSISRIVLPDDACKIINNMIAPGKRFSLFDFINLLSSYDTCTDNNVFNEELIKTVEFYKDNKKFINTINSIEATIKNELLMIYRQRNQIVHKASYDNSLLDYYISKLQFVVMVFLRDLIVNLPKEKSLNNFILNQYMKSEKIRSMIKNNAINSPEELLNK